MGDQEQTASVIPSCGPPFESIGPPVAADGENDQIGYVTAFARYRADITVEAISKSYIDVISPTASLWENLDGKPDFSSRRRDQTMTGFETQGRKTILRVVLIQLISFMFFHV